MYKVVTTPSGRNMYYHDGKLTSIKNIPDHIAIALASGTKELDETQYEDKEMKQTQDKSCIFCGQPTNIERLVNLQRVYICEEHYHTTNIGQIAQKIREKDLVTG